MSNDKRVPQEWAEILNSKDNVKRRARKIALYDILYEYTRYLDSRYRLFYSDADGSTEDVAKAVSRFTKNHSITIDTLLNMD